VVIILGVRLSCLDHFVFGLKQLSYLINQFWLCMEKRCKVIDFGTELEKAGGREIDQGGCSENAVGSSGTQDRQLDSVHADICRLLRHFLWICRNY